MTAVAMSIRQTPIEQTIAQLEQWIADVQADRDWRAQLLEAGALSPVERAFVEVKLCELERELAEVTEWLENLKKLRDKPPFILTERPKQARASLRPAAARAEAS